MSLRHNILLTNSTNIYGGGEFFVYELALSLRGRGHAVTVSCTPGNLLLEKCRASGIETEPLDFPASGRLRFFINRLRDIIHRRRIGLVHTNSNYDRTAGAFAARFSGARHVTNVHSFHSIQYNLTHWIRNRFATDHFLVDGYCVRDLLVREDGISPGKISVIHLGVDPASMTRNSRSRVAVRTEFSIPESAIVAGNVGRLVPMKGQEDLLSGFASAARSNDRLVLLLVGDGELGVRLRERARELGVEGRVIFAGFRDDLVALYSAFDIYVHSSVEGGGETFPFAVLQALAQRLPVVATRVGDVGEMVENGTSGFLVPDRNPEALADSLGRLALDEELRGRMAAASHALFLSRFTRDKMVDSIMNVYDRIIAG